MSEIFLLGAGFSKGISDEMPLLAELSQKVLNPEEADLFGQDVEMCLTFLSQSHPWLSEAENLRNRARFIDLSRKISEVLKKCMGEALKKECPVWLRKLVHWWHEKQVSVLTLNYDTIVERVASEIKATGETLDCFDIYPVTLTPAGLREAAVLGGERHFSFKLFKLHGFINWFYSGSSSFYGETIYCVPVRGGWQSSEDEIEKNYREAVTDKVPLIVPPMTEKTQYFQHETMRDLWMKAAIALREATKIFCLGYSLPQTDITMRFFLHNNRPKSQVKFYIANTNEKVTEHFCSLLPHYYEIDSHFVGK
ncbi:MAG: hypothetical protein QXQ02_08295, partial [Halobacteria archaeon]